MSGNITNRKEVVWNALTNCTRDALITFPIDVGIQSPVFEVSIGSDITKWYLEIYPCAYDRSHMSFYLHPHDYLSFQFIVNSTFYIKGKFGKYAEVTFHGSSGILNHRQGFDNFISHEDFNQLFDELVIDGNLVLGCEITIYSQDKISVESSYVAKVSDHIQMMFEDASLADFELRCNDGQHIMCHKVILAARSLVFRAMFSNNMQETREGFAEIKEFESTIIKEMLRFMYCDRTENLDSISMDLIFAAEKYDLEVLKQMCIDNISQNVTKENVVEVLLITERISGCEKLFKKSVEVVSRDFIDTSQSQEWAKLSPNTLMKIIFALKEPHIIEIIG